jgi:hypothetical protein
MSEGVPRFGVFQGPAESSDPFTEGFPVYLVGPFPGVRPFYFDVHGLLSR